MNARSAGRALVEQSSSSSVGPMGIDMIRKRKPSGVDLDEFGVYLHVERGLSDSTVRNYILP